MPSTAVRPESILKDLARLWADLGKEDNANEKAGVLRACAIIQQKAGLGCDQRHGYACRRAEAPCATARNASVEVRWWRTDP